MKPHLTVTASVAVVLAGVVVRLLLYRMPLMREELTRQEQTRRQLEQERQSLTLSVGQLRYERELRQQLQNELARLTGVEANVPLMMLEATRAGESSVNTLVVPTGARSIILWIEVDPGARSENFRLELHSSNHRTIQTVEGLKKDRYGALVARHPAESLHAGSYRVMLYGVSGQHRSLVGEHRIRVV
ncbi:MAG TPA: hypothetical protein VNM72_14640 [Blastocatellia bacterium]|nr:hypothetical protein [Blastocatellia bacterium]